MKNYVVYNESGSYESPLIEVLDVAVEEGFAVSSQLQDWDVESW